MTKRAQTSLKRRGLNVDSTQNGRSRRRGPREDPVFYFHGSAVTRLANRLADVYPLIPLGDVTLPEPVDAGVLLVDLTAPELERAAAFRRGNTALEIIAFTDSPTIPTAASDTLYACLPADLPARLIAQTIAHAFASLRLRQERERITAELARRTTELQELNAVGIKLSVERDRESLFELILTKAREITHSDAGSVYLVEEDGASDRFLRFRWVQNDSFPVHFEEFTLPLTPDSVAGFVAMTGQIVNVEDAYDLRPASPFQVNRTFDGLLGYRTKSMLVVPMKTPQGETIGVLELINCKTDPAQRFGGLEDIERDAIPFSAIFQDFAASLASQAAVALENNRLYRELRLAVDELQASQQQVIQIERLRALGEMAAGVVHDFKNILAIILGRVQLLLKHTGSPELHRQLQVIEKAAVDGALTVKRIQEFARKRPAQPFQPVDLSVLIDEVIELTRSRWKNEAEAHGIVYTLLREPGSVPLAVGDPVELREALINIVFNALDAMPQGGVLTFTAGTGGPSVFIRISDTGLGMTEEVRRRVFDPFFTTKGERGTGLGLSVVYGTIARHGGDIEVESEVGRGTSFTLSLPAAGDVPDLPSSSSPIEIPTRAAKILVIEAEPEGLEVLVELLTGYGHTVVACGEGRSSLDRLHEGPFDLVITDLGMPGLSGWEVARLVKGQDPQTPVALLTGWSDEIDADEARKRGADFILSKPFKLEEVTALVSRALGRKAQA